MNLRITIVCPKADINDANQLALCLGNGPADIHTFRDAIWTDGNGGNYALASLLAEASFPQRSAQKLEAPAYAEDMNLEAANRAQAKLTVWTPYSEGALPTVSPDKILAIIGLEPALTLPMLKLEPEVSEI